MGWIELFTAVGAGAGAFAAAYGAAQKLRGRQKHGAETAADHVVLGRLASLDFALDRLEQDVREARQARQTFPELAEFRERLVRLEDDVRENATASGHRLDQLLEKVGELRGTVGALNDR